MNKRIHLLLINIFKEDYKTYDIVLLATSQNKTILEYLQEDYIKVAMEGYESIIKFLKDNNAILLGNRSPFDPTKYAKQSINNTYQSIYIMSADVHMIGVLGV